MATSHAKESSSSETIAKVAHRRLEWLWRRRQRINQQQRRVYVRTESGPIVGATATEAHVLQADFLGVTATPTGTLEVEVTRDTDAGMRFYVPRAGDRSNAWFDDFDRATVADAGWSTSNTGTGASVFAATDHINSTENVLGEVGLSPGTTSTGRASLYRTGSGILLGTHAIDLEFRGTVGTAADVTDDYVVQFGLLDNPTANAEATNGVYFCYRRATDGDYWVCLTIDNASETKTVTSVVAAGYSVLETFRIQVNQAGTSATFTIDGVVVATHVTNIPTAAGRRVGVGFKHYKTAGTTARYSYLDYCGFTATRSSAR